MGNRSNKLHPSNRPSAVTSPLTKLGSGPSKSPSKGQNKSPSSQLVLGNKKKSKKAPKSKMEPKPIKGKVNPQDHEEIAISKLNLEINEQKRPPVMRILMPSFRYQGYKIVKLKKYCEDKTIYSVTDDENKPKLLFQYKFYDINEIHIKCKTLSMISKLELQNFHICEDFFVDYEEVDYHSFFYLNVVCGYQRTLTLFEIINILQKKAKEQIDESFLWEIIRNILNSINFAYQNKINFNFNKAYIVLPKKKRIEERPIMLASLIKLLGKGFKNNSEIIFFNKVSMSRKKKKGKNVYNKLHEKAAKYKILLFRFHLFPRHFY